MADRGSVNNHGGHHDHRSEGGGEHHKKEGHWRHHCNKHNGKEKADDRTAHQLRDTAEKLQKEGKYELAAELYKAADKIDKNQSGGGGFLDA